MNYEEASARARIWKALGHPARVLIVDELSRAARCGCELLPLLGVDQSVVSRHLDHLKNAGVIGERKEGARVIYSLACPCILDALKCADGVLKVDAARRSRIVKGMAATDRGREERKVLAKVRIS